MKSIQTHIYIIVALFLIAFLGGCKKDELNSKELLAYTKASDGKNSITLNLTISPLITLGDSTARFPMYLTRETSVDVNLTLQSDTSLVESYNKANNTSYELLPNVNYKFSTSSLTVKAGNFTSLDSLELQIINTKTLTGDKGYLLPISISEIKSDDKGVTISSNFRTVYIVVMSKVLNIDSSNMPFTDPNLDRTGWTATASSSYAEELGASNVLDGDHNTSWFVDNESQPYLEIDMGASKTIKGFSIVPNYGFVSSIYDFLSMEVFVSNDNIVWRSQGVYAGTATNSLSTPSNPDLKTVRFISPLAMRYVRFKILSGSNSYSGIGEIYAK